MEPIRWATQRVGMLVCVALAACSGGTTSPTPTGSTGEAEIDFGDCKADATRNAAATSGDTGQLPDTTVHGEAVDGHLVVHIDDLRANCCPSPAATFTRSGASVDVELTTVTATSSCDCSCVFDVSVTSPDEYEAGEWSVDVRVDGALLGVGLSIVVP